MACSVECLNFFEDCYKSPNKSLYAELPNSLILKIIQEADGGRYTHKQNLKKVHQEMRDIIARSMNNYQQGLQVEDECSWRPINKSDHSGEFWCDIKMVNIDWIDLYEFMFVDEFWDTHADNMVQDSIISLWCLGDDLSVFGRLGYNEAYRNCVRSCHNWNDMTDDNDWGFRIYSDPRDCRRYALQ